MSAIFYVVKDDDFVVVEVDAVDEDVDDAAAEGFIQQVALAELPHPGLDLLQGVAVLAGNAQLGQLQLHLGLLGFQQFHLVKDALAGGFGRVQQGVHQLVQVSVQAVDGAGRVLHGGEVEVFLVLRDHRLGDVVNALRRQDILDGLLHHVPLREALLFVRLLAGLGAFAGGAGIIMIDRAAALAAFADHVGTAVAAEGLALQLVIHLGLGGRRRAGDLPDTLLDAQEQVF